MTGYSTLNTPERRLIFREEVDPADAHGATLTKHQKYLWVADRGRNFMWVVDTLFDRIVNRIYLAGNVSTDPTPDLLAISPKGKYVYMSLRSPPPGIIKVTQGGRNGIFEAFAPISNIAAGGVQRVDAHALSVRVTK